MWRVYYDDGSTWDWKKGMVDIPSFGVICILQDQPNGYQIVHGSKYYLYSNEWLHAYENDIIDYLIHDKPIRKLLVGRIISNETFNEIFENAKQDKDRENL